MNGEIVTIPIAGGLRPFPILGDSMEPMFRRGDFAFVVPVNDYCGEGIYVVGDPRLDGPPGIYRVSTNMNFRDPRIVLSSENQLYRPHEVDRAWFRESVLAKAVFKLNVWDQRFVPPGWRV